MEIRTLKIGKRNWQLVNESWSTSRAWGHKTNILKNGIEYAEHKCRYYNRTWESYTYQNCMFGAIRTLREQEENRFIENYKYTNNIDRFKKGQKDLVIAEFNKTEIAKDLDKLYKAVELREFN